MGQNAPPSTLDGARVLYWAWSGDEIFGQVNFTNGSLFAKIHGLAICKYETGPIYLFSCNEDWEVVGDYDFESVVKAKDHVSSQYGNQGIRWFGEGES
jgi:hypothetical protein